MKLFTGVYQNQEQVFILSGDGKRACPIRSLRLPGETMRELIAAVSLPELLSHREAAEQNAEIPLDAIRLRPPITRPGLVFCLGENYPGHAAEAYRVQNVEFHGEQPNAVYFGKYAHTVSTDGDPIDGQFDLVKQMDYEVELAAVLSREARHVPAENAKDYIFGYAVANDYSARDLQMAHRQYFFGKSLDGYLAMGTMIVTADEFDLPPSRRIRCWVNEELRQDDYTDRVYFTIDRIIAELSSVMTLEAGSIILTGTPKGMGMAMTPPRFLQSGDTVRCEIEGIGTLTNTII